VEGAEQTIELGMNDADEVLETYRLAVRNVPGAGREVDPLALLHRLRRRAALAVGEIEDEEERARLLVELQGIGRARGQ
jgi:hypothetical protein